MSRLFLSLLSVLVVAGCKSKPTFGPYVSPRVTGQVLAEDTRRPLAGVSVTRGVPDKHGNGLSQPKGAELLMQKPPALTDHEGVFVLASERVLSVIRGSGWNVVPLSFLRVGYYPFQTNCQTSDTTNLVNGEPVLNIGRVFLTPVAH